jgi:acetate kinase
MNVLVVNAGSSSIKFALYELPEQYLLLRAHVDGIGSKTTKISFAGATITKAMKTHKEAMEFLFTHLPQEVVIDMVVHRVVHGGEEFTTPTKITSAVLKKIKKLSSLAPLHVPANIAGIESAKSVLPKAKHVAVFDTAFHSTIPEVAYRYGVEEAWYNKYGVRKYGFHGMSHQYIMQQSKNLLRKKSVNIISCHLGNGSSICAIKKNKSIETSMGFSPLSGVMMGTRSGDIDPEVMFFLKEKGVPYKEVEQHLQKHSGFKGLMGTNDLRKIYAKAKAGNKKAKFTIDLFSYEVARYVGMYASLLGSIDALVFTGGIGEAAFYVRKKIVDYLPLLGIKLDSKKNYANKERIHAKNSKLKVYVIPTNEELVMVQEALRL